MDDSRKEFEAKLPKWLPIAEAPNDGIKIIVTHEDGNADTARIVWWGKIKLSNGHKQEGWKLTAGVFLRYTPTHFMLLPKPPKE